MNLSKSLVCTPNAKVQAATLEALIATAKRMHPQKTGDYDKVFKKANQSGKYDETSKRLIQRIIELDARQEASARSSLSAK